MIELLTGTLVLVTGFYAWVTFRILKANENVVSIMQEQSEAISRPYITVSTFLGPEGEAIYLKISNTGKTAAKKLRLEMDKDFYKFGRKTENSNLSKFGAFQTEIECFSPNAELIFPLAQGFVIFGEQADPKVTPRTFNIKTTYSYLQKTVVEITIIDLNAYLNSSWMPTPILKRLDKFVDKMESIEKAIKEIKPMSKNS
jgi:hypothetical protein